MFLEKNLLGKDRRTDVVNFKKSQRLYAHVCL